MAFEVKLERCAPLGGWSERLAEVGGDELQIEIAPFHTLINLRGAPSDQSLVTDVQRALGVELPMAPNRWHGDDRIAAAWLGPDEWLLIGPDGGAKEFEQAIRDARPIDPWLSVVDVSHNYICFSVSGRRARELLAKGCALDLRPHAFSAGDCAQTVIGKSRVLLRALAAPDLLEIWVRNSFAGYMAAWMLDASAEFGLVQGVPER